MDSHIPRRDDSNPRTKTTANEVSVDQKPHWIIQQSQKKSISGKATYWGEAATANLRYLICSSFVIRLIFFSYNLEDDRFDERER